MSDSIISSSVHSGPTGRDLFSHTPLVIHYNNYDFCSSAITRDQYKRFLKDRYRQPLPDDDKLLVTPSKHYIELAVISKEGITSKLADEFTRKSLHGLTEEILRKKAPIELKDILKASEAGTPVRCVLIEGAPGIGKSTLAWEVCHKWEELESVKQYELVILVRLREKKAQEACCLEDLLPHDATTKVNELLNMIGRGKGILIVCDGFDELPQKQREKDSVYIDLLKGRLLPEAVIVVTSRPSVSADLWNLCRHNIDRHLEVIGFTKEDIKRFAESVFSGDILAGFLSYITSNPPIYGMMYIPLNTVIVVLIYQDLYDTDTPFPTTMTQLFDALTRALVRRHLVSTHLVPRTYCMPSSLRSADDIGKLSPLVAQQLLHLARVAYERLREKSYIFTDLGEKFDHLGMMKKTTSMNVSTGPECSFSFLHLTLQEFLTALYIAIVNPSDFELAKWLKDGSVVVRFLAGICSHDDSDSRPVHQDELVRLLATECLNVRKSLQLVHCTYECHSIMDSVKVDYSECDSLPVCPLVGFDWYATGYCINRFDEIWRLDIGDDACEPGLDLLMKGLRSSPDAKGRIQSMQILNNSLSLSRVITSLREYCNLWHLELVNVDIQDEDEVILRQLIAPGSRLRLLFYYNGYRESGIKTFIPLLLQQSSVQELQLVISGDIIIKTELLPDRNEKLEKLTISRNLLHQLAALIQKFTSLTYLAIAEPQDDDLPVLTNLVQSHETLEILELDRIRDHDKLKDASTNMLQLIETSANHQIKELRIRTKNYDKLPPHIQENYKHLLKQSNSNIA